jgi:AraC family transcriptional regulator
MTDRSYGSLTQFYEQVHAPALIDIRPAGQMGASLLRVRQTPGDWSDPPVPDLVIAQSFLRPLRLQFDVGAGHVQMVARPGAICVVPPDISTFFLMDDPHQVRFLTLPYRRLLAFAGQDCGLPPDGDFGVLHAGMFQDTGITEGLSALFAEAEAGNPLGALWADGVILQLTARLLWLRRGQVRSRQASHLPTARLRQAAEILRDRLDEDIGLTEVARTAGMSPFHFARQFSAMFGMSPVQYRIAARIEAAQQLLRQKALPVSEIARRVGYADVSRFGQHFRRKAGMTPSAWRKG